MGPARVAHPARGNPRARASSTAYGRSGAHRRLEDLNSTPSSGAPQLKHGWSSLEPSCCPPTRQTRPETGSTGSNAGKQRSSSNSGYSSWKASPGDASGPRTGGFAKPSSDSRPSREELHAGGLARSQRVASCCPLTDGLPRPWRRHGSHRIRPRVPGYGEHVLSATADPSKSPSEHGGRPRRALPR